MVIDPVPNEWYFAVHCRSCKRLIRFFPDESKGTRPITANKTLKIICPDCKMSGPYSTAEMVSTQEPPNSQS